MYFKKLDLTFDAPDFQVGKLAIKYGLKVENKFHGIWYNEIDKENECLLIPPGYAHGYECYSKENIVIYFLSWPYSSKLQSGIFWADKDLNLKWKVKKPILSKRDKNLLTFRKILNKKYY